MQVELSRQFIYFNVVLTVIDDWKWFAVSYKIGTEKIFIYLVGENSLIMQLKMDKIHFSYLTKLHSWPSLNFFAVTKLLNVFRDHHLTQCLRRWFYCGTVQRGTLKRSVLLETVRLVELELVVSVDVFFDDLAGSVGCDKKPNMKAAVHDLRSWMPVDFHVHLAELASRGDLNDLKTFVNPSLEAVDTHSLTMAGDCCWPLKVFTNNDV